MNSFPELINIKLINNETKHPISNIAIMIKIFARNKIDYYYRPPVSNEEGVISIERSLVENEINKTQELFPADYSSNLSDCEPKIEISIMSQEDIFREIQSMNDWKGVFEINEKEMKSLSQLNNINYMSLVSILNFNNQSIVNSEYYLKEINQFR